MILKNFGKCHLFKEGRGAINPYNPLYPPLNKYTAGENVNVLGFLGVTKGFVYIYHTEAKGLVYTSHWD